MPPCLPAVVLSKTGFLLAVDDVSTGCSVLVGAPGSEDEEIKGSGGTMEEAGRSVGRFVGEAVGAGVVTGSGE